MKISFHSYANKTNFHMKTFALSLAFIVRFTATRKWPIRHSREYGETGTSKGLWDCLGRRMDIAADG